MTFYLTPEEVAYVKSKGRGWLRQRVQEGMALAEKQREAEIASQPVIEERHERFMEEA